MSTDLLIDIEPSGSGGLELRVNADTPGGQPTQLDRQRIVLDHDKLDLLRAGELSIQECADIAARVSQWLLDKDLLREIDHGLKDRGALRVVFRVRDEHLIDELSDVPFELARGIQPLVFYDNLRGVVHFLSKVGQPRLPQSERWPLRVLLVRANPRDLGADVPEIHGLVQHIKALASGFYGDQFVIVDAWSSEEDIGRPATWEAVRDALGEAAASGNPYDILVFLGHGDTQPLPVPTGFLLFEDAQRNPEPVAADQLKLALQEWPVPVVLLAGCLTAVDPATVDPGKASTLKASVPRWMRGAQGVAQALINSPSGVRVAVGMRYKLDAEDAMLFLKAFFKSLLVGDARGDVDQAVRAGRFALYQERIFPPAWSAPVVFRTLEPEPTFEFLQHPPTLEDPLDQRDQSIRRAAWEALSRLSGGARAAGAAEPMRSMLAEIEPGLLQRATQGGLQALAPPRVETVPGAQVTLPIKLCSPPGGRLSAAELEGRVVFSDPALLVTRVRPSDALQQAGFTLFIPAAPVQGELSFLLRRPAGAAPLPEDVLFQIELTVGQAAPAVYTVRVEDVRVKPPIPLRGWTDAIIVSFP